jgi:hypothetical protein
VTLQLAPLDVSDRQRVQGVSHRERSLPSQEATSSLPMISGVLPN